MMGMPIPTLEYSEQEDNLWNKVYTKLRKGAREYGTKEMNKGIDMLEKDRVFTETKVPNLEEVNQYLQEKSNWRFKLAGGSIDQREFLNMLAFRTSTCTQYIRHHSDPYFTPEPDIVHDLCGHVPMLLNKEYCDFNQKIGMLSLGATDEQLQILAAVYWFTAEFGVCYEDGKRKFYGAGIASSVSEMENWLSKEGKDIPFDIRSNLPRDYEQETLKPEFFITESYKDVVQQFNGLDKLVNKSFQLSYDEKSNSYEVDRKIFVEEKTLPKGIQVSK